MNSLALLCRVVAAHEPQSQRELADALKLSVGSVNNLLKEGTQVGYVHHEDNRYKLTAGGAAWLEQYRVDNAIILAAGFGSRFVPYTYETPKGLLKVKGTPMIDRQIEQLHACGVTEVVVVVGYLAEMFEYLIDKYGVTLVYNPEYAVKNNFVSLYYAREHLANSYVLVADNWIEESIFYSWEPDSWICCTYHEGKTEDWHAVCGPHNRITRIEVGAENDWVMIGPAFFNRELSAAYVPLLESYYERPGTANYYWEHLIKENIRSLTVYANQQSTSNVYEFESLDDLRAYDDSYLNDPDNEILTTIATVFNVAQASITGIRPMDEGMTNHSFVFEVAGAQYVYRNPGAGTDMLINRANEKRSYELVAPLGITDEIIYFDGQTGVKITRYYQDARVGDPFNDDELRTMMETLRCIHEANIQPGYDFDIGERIAYYEALANERNSILFEDYAEVREHARALLAFKDTLAVPTRLCHIDYIYANALFFPNGEVRVIDWEYSGAADPLIDVAMFALYTYYTREQANRALYLYLGREPKRQEEARLYLYLALGGFLWSIWTEYKQGLGDDFGEYALDMYRYMKDYYKILGEEDYLNGN